MKIPFLVIILSLLVGCESIRTTSDNVQEVPSKYTMSISGVGGDSLVIKNETNEIKYPSKAILSPKAKEQAPIKKTAVKEIKKEEVIQNEKPDNKQSVGLFLIIVLVLITASLLLNRHIRVFQKKS